MSLKQKTVSGSFWTFLELGASKGISLLVQIILARLLTPADFGLVAMIMIFIVIGQAIVDSGMNASIIRTKDADNSDYSTVFFVNVSFALVIYGLIFLAAPFVAQFYNQPKLVELLRVIGLVIPIQSFYSIHKTILTKKMDFKTQVLIGLPANVFGGVVAIICALNGFSYWSLAILQIFQFSFMLLFYWIFGSWKPSFVFSKEKFNKHIRFGYKLTITSLLHTFFDELYTIIIGKKFSESTVGLYNRAYTFQNLPTFIFARAVNRVTYPLFSELQNDNVRLKEAYKNISLIVLVIYSTVMFSLFFCAEEFIFVVLGEKWVKAIPMFKILCLAGILKPFIEYHYNIINAKGKSSLVLNNMVLGRLFMLLGTLFFMQFGLTPMLYFLILNTLVLYLIFSFSGGKEIGYPLLYQLRDIIPVIVLTLLVSFCIKWCVSYLGSFISMNMYSFLIIYGCLNTFAIMTIGYLLGFKSVHQILLFLKDRIKKK